ncbi:TonB-dependent receptor [Temperatibacter marinus]|uniref:TonB-dependent receptor n=1 Tax=Temperatibacter marinus TaxID=1456591 RepID=A0AA52EHC2_9PROT|nr:TonB-dependent receptor [Temperatibacter marinus]WND02532.1 TonB-dependent receptor [Temperatibacter marinus]
MKYTAFNSLLLSGVCLSSLSLTAPVMAQEDEFSLEEIVVTARRREESLQDAPVAITAFSANEIANRGLTDITELAQSLPSVTLEASRATNSTLTAFIRGVGQQDPLAGFEPGVAIYIDDIYLARPQGALLEILDVERIEVLRGPQGTLYGRNAMGGAIKYVTKKLPEEASLSVSGRYGSYNQTDILAAASAPISEGFIIGGAIARLKRDGFGKNLTLGTDNYDKDIFAARLTAELSPSDSFFVRLMADYTDDDSGAKHGHRLTASNISGEAVLDDVFDTRAGAETNASTSGINGNNEVENKGISGLIEWAVNDSLTVKSITSYREDYTESVIDFDSLAIDDLDAAVIYENDQFTQEFQALYNTDTLNVVAGFYYINANAANDFDVVLGQLGRVAFGSELTAYTGGDVNTKSWSLFTDVTYDLDDAWSLTLGGRYTSDKRSADVLRQSFLGTPSPFFGGSAVAISTTSDFENSRTFKDFTPRILVNYKPSDALNFYASYSQGFKAGGFDPRGANLVAGGEDVEEGFSPETLTSYELGLKTTFLDGRAQTNIALFYSDYSDMQIPGSLPIDTDGDGTDDDFVGTVTNAGKATIKGFEFEGTLAVTESFILKGSMSILDAKIDEWLVNDVNVADQRKVQNTPEFNASIAANYTYTMANDSALNFNISWAHVGKVYQFETPVDLIDQDAYSLFNASIVWSDPEGQYTIGLHGKNIFDKKYKVAGYNFPTLGLEGTITAFYGAPATVNLTVGAKF